MNDNIYIAIILFLVLIIIIVVSIVILQRVYLIEAIACPPVKGSYAVIPNTASTPIRSCGSNNNEVCSSLQTDLANAILECDRRADICKSFTYNFYSGEMVIIDHTGTQTSSSGTNLYIRQVNIINSN